MLNEVYMQLNNDPADTFLVNVNDDDTKKQATKDYRLNTWVELYNPIPADATNTVRNDTTAILQRAGAEAIYQIVFAKDGLTTILSNPANTKGDPNFNVAMGTSNMLRDSNGAGVVGMVDKILTNWTDTSNPAPATAAPLQVLPATSYRDAAKLNTGFYVIGPDNSAFKPAADPAVEPKNPGLPVTLHNSLMTWIVPKDSLTYDSSASIAGTNGMNGYAEAIANGATALNARPTILLRRLACPGMANNEDPTSAVYNPYITVDYVTHDGTDKYVYEARTYRKPKDATEVTGMKINQEDDTTPGPRLLATNRATYGRNQPYAAAVAQRIQQTAAGTNAPKNTFYRHNAAEAEGTTPSSGTANQTLKLPFDWLAFLDRQLISPTELFQVPAAGPGRVTQVFGTAGNVFAHLAPWQDANSRLYRALEFLQTKSRARGITPGGHSSRQIQH